MTDKYTLGRQSMAKEIYDMIMAHYGEEYITYKDKAKQFDKMLCEIFDYVKKEMSQAA